MCAGPELRPCGRCQHCRYAADAVHPDIHWYFPRPRLKEGDASPARIEDDFAEAIADRVRSGAYAPPPPEDAIFVSTIRAMVHSAAMAPALADRKIYVVGDAERMVVRENAEDAAGAFLKLLEEPPVRTTIILTSSEPGALIPTIRSRLVAARVSALPAADVKAVLAEPAMRDAISSEGAFSDIAEQVGLAAGAPGVLLARAEWSAAVARARTILESASSRDRTRMMRTALMQGSSKARGAFSTALDALTTLLHERLRSATNRSSAKDATAAARAVEVVERAKERAAGNVNPQLVTSELLRELHALLA